MAQPRTGRRPDAATARPQAARPQAARPQTARPQTARPQTARPQGARPRSGGARAQRPAAVQPVSALDQALADALTREYPQDAGFADLGLPPVLVRALHRRGLDRPFPIQTRTLPDALAGRDVLGRAATGSGKTLAFGLPMLSRLAGDDGLRRTGVDSARHRVTRTPRAPRALVLVPSRELALQVTGNLAPLADTVGLRVSSVVGGAPYGRQVDALERGVDVLVATPGRLVDLIERGAARLDQIEISVLDEADYMADLGFLPVVTRLLEQTPRDAQRLLFSATLDRAVSGLVDRFLREPVVHAVATATASIPSMTHRVFVLDQEDKVRIAAEVATQPARTLIFVRTKHGAARLAKQLGRSGVEAVALHGNLAQNARQRVLAEFAGGDARVMVATDVAARGIHVDGVNLVVHYDPPADHKDYLHRSGRTARAGSEGTVVSFVLPEQAAAVRKVHADAKVEAIEDAVGPGHPAIRALTRA